MANLKSDLIISSMTGFSLEELKDLFELEDFKQHACTALSDCGIPSPLNRVVYWGLEKAIFSGGTALGEKGRKIAFSVLEKTPGIRLLFQRFLEIRRKASEKEQLRQALLEELRTRPAELKNGKVEVDHTTEIEILEVLYQQRQLEELPLHIRKILGPDFEALRRDVTALFQSMVEPKLYWQEALSEEGGVIDGLYYANERDPFVGRQQELELLDQFLGTPDMHVPGNRFRWMMLTGPGGEGKSRLALNFSKTVAGPEGWHHGRLDASRFTRIDAENWRPRRKTLIVIDYAARTPEAVVDLLVGFARNRRHYDFAVRVLLLEREADSWFANALASAADGAALRNTAFLPDPYALEISPVMPSEIIDLMADRFRRAGLEPPSGETLIHAAHSVDQREIEYEGNTIPFPRPLFAAAAAQALIDMMRSGISAQHLPAELDRDKVLHGLIESDRAKRWRPACPDPDILAEHERLLALATFAQGVERSALGKLPKETLQWLPDVGPKGARPLNPALLARMGGLSLDLIQQLEPDILGEFFVLDLLQGLAKTAAEAIPALTNAAFQLAEQDAVIFIMRCANDFPERLEQIGFLEPTDQGARYVWAGTQLAVGDRWMTHRDVATAAGRYDAALETMRDLTAADPRNTEWQRDLSVSHNKIGDVRTAQGDLAGALEAYEDDLAIAKTLAAADPRNTTWQRDLSVSHDRIGDVRTAQGDLAGALEAYEDGLAIRKTLAAADSRNTQWQRDLSVSHNKIGDVRTAQGDWAGALEAYEDGLAIAKTLAAADPRNTLWQRDLSVSHNKIGDVRTAQGDLTGALGAYEDGLAIRKTLAAADPRNTQWQRDLITAHVRLSEVDKPNAANHLRQALAVAEALAATGRLAPVDAWMPAALKRRLDALPK